MKHKQLYLSILILSIASCSSLSVRNKKSYDKTQASALKGNTKAWTSIDEALKNPPPKNDPNLHKIIFSKLGMLQDQNAEKILKKYLQDPNEKKREEAFKAYNRRKKFSSAKEINSHMLQAMGGNILRFGKWTQTEKNIFASLDEKTQINFLQSLKLPYDNKFYLDTLQTLLAKEVSRSSNKIITPSKGKRYENLLLQSAFSAEREKRNGNKIFDKVSFAYAQNAKPHFTWLINEVLQENSEKEKFQKKIITTYAQKKFGIQIFSPTPPPKPKQIITKKIELAPKKDRKKPLKKVSLKNKSATKKQLIDLAKKYHLNSKVFIAMEQNIYSHVHDKSKKAEQRYLFTVMREIYPNEDFFTLRKHLKNPFENNFFFTTLMKVIKRETSEEEMRILILQKIGGINYQESATLWKIYKKEFL